MIWIIILQHWVNLAETRRGKQEYATSDKHRIVWQRHIYNSSGIHAASCPTNNGISSSDTHLHPVSEKRGRGQKEEENKVFSLSAMKAYRGSWRTAPFILHLGMQVGGYTPAALTLVLVEWGWKGTGAGLHVLKKSKISFPYRESNPRPPVHSLVATLTVLPSLKSMSVSW